MFVWLFVVFFFNVGLIAIFVAVAAIVAVLAGLNTDKPWTEQKTIDRQAYAYTFKCTRRGWLWQETTLLTFAKILFTRDVWWTSENESFKPRLIVIYKPTGKLRRDALIKCIASK